MSWLAPELDSFGWCPFAKITGQPCPLCGGSRAIVDLLSGQFNVAWNHNAAIVVATPFALFWILKYVRIQKLKWGHIQETLEAVLRARPYLFLSIGAIWWAWNIARFQ